MLDQTDIFD